MQAREYAAGGRRQALQQLMSVQGDKESPALTLLLVELFQNIKFIIVQ